MAMPVEKCSDGAASAAAAMFIHGTWWPSVNSIPENPAASVRRASVATLSQVVARVMTSNSMNPPGRCLGLAMPVAGGSRLLAMDAAHYAATERLRNGAVLHIRAVRPADRPAMEASIGRSSARTLYRRFFSPKRTFSERDVDFFLNVDFQSHVALVAALAED